MKQELNSEIGTLNKNSVLPYFTKGSWCAHQLLEFLINQTGPAEVHLTAFSLSESSVRSLFFLMESKQITNIHCLFNKEIRRFKTDLSLFASNFINNIRIANIHAKLMIIENESWKVCVISSANFSENRRYEAGCIITVPEMVDKMKNEFMNLYNQSMEMYD